ncbi:hypothetical protein NEOLEDRAFT_1128250 [Neolentinus lepideus HHB14362 ss-1]|uniref:Uncharacterized protein n=1 Tax=Neolentinus lepideus HHB14362 ss-1 TaxID=1314782 RepID=A0A165VCQ0_9AGAM|nr:hypothetical protein NEOLEDRAFT_1128250 [Neolentinus lepideus HHB14362 ss-1]
MCPRPSLRYQLEANSGCSDGQLQCWTRNIQMHDDLDLTRDSEQLKEDETSSAGVVNRNLGRWRWWWSVMQ